MYKAILFAPDGDFVTDYKADTVEGVWEQIENGGSRWFFYPFAFVILDKRPGAGASESQRIVSAPQPFQALQGKTISTASKRIQDFIAAYGDD